MTKIALIGSGVTNDSIEKIEAMLKAKGMNDVIVIGADESLPECIPGPSFKIEARPEPIIPKMIEYRDFKDGKTSRRDRRKKERKNR